jgi:hypothetical protein
MERECVLRRCCINGIGNADIEMMEGITKEGAVYPLLSIYKYGPEI